MDYVHEEADVYGRCKSCRHIHNSERCIEEQIKATIDAIEASAKECVADSGGMFSEDDAYHDIAQSLMTMCLPAVAKEVARRTGVPQLNVRTDDEEETWLSSC